jgi:integrase
MASLRHRCNRWHVQIRKSGHSSINKSFIKKADAERWARETEVAIENGTIRTGAEHSLKTPLSSILTRYQSEISAHKAGGHIERYIINHWLKTSLSARPIGTIKGSDIAAELDKQRSEWQPATIRKNFGLLRHVFNTAMQLWDIPLKENPVSKVPLPAVSGHVVRRIPPSFWAALDEHFKDRPKNNIYWVIQFAVQTGLRRGNISILCAQTWDALIDFAIFKFQRCKVASILSPT